MIHSEVCLQHSDSRCAANIFRLEVQLTGSVVAPGMFTHEVYLYLVQQRLLKMYYAAVAKRLSFNIVSLETTLPILAQYNLCLCLSLHLLVVEDIL